jgi:hypothetical protein
MKTFAFLILSAGLVLVTACGSAATPVESNIDNPFSSTPMPIDTTNPSTMPPTLNQQSHTVPPASNQLSPIEQNMIDLSRQNLSQRLKIGIDQVAVVSIKQITWRDASLGCPKPGIDYIRVETPGYTVVLEAGGENI